MLQGRYQPRLMLSNMIPKEHSSREKPPELFPSLRWRHDCWELRNLRTRQVLSSDSTTGMKEFASDTELRVFLSKHLKLFHPLCITVLNEKVSLDDWWIFYWFFTVKSETVLHSAHNAKILKTDKKLHLTVLSMTLFQRPFWEDIMKGRCVYTSTLRKRLIRKRSKRTWLILQRLTKWTNQWGNQTHSPPRLPGSLRELNPLMNYNTPQTMITWASQKSLC